MSDPCFSRDSQDSFLDIERLQVKRGTRILIEGSNGSGKSTLLRLIANVVLPQKGAIGVNGRTTIGVNHRCPSCFWIAFGQYFVLTKAVDTIYSVYYLVRCVCSAARGNLVQNRDCPAAVSGNDRRHQALTQIGLGSDGQ
jgi:energy-coupling factor transporter ATP-binding protein EcfA2